MRNLPFNPRVERIARLASSLKGVDLSTAQGLTEQMLETAYGVKSGDGVTLLPDYIDEEKRPVHWYCCEEEVRLRGPDSVRSYEDAYIEFNESTGRS